VSSRVVETFMRLAGIDSPSRAERALADVLLADLEHLGWDVADDGSGPSCGNVLASLAGDEQLEPLLLTSHMDVVMPCLGVRPRIDVESNTIVSDGSTVLGADAKASVAVLLDVAERLSGPLRETPRPPLELLFTWGEEIGHLGAKSLDVTRLRSRRALVLDGLVPVGSIIVAAPTYYSFTVQVRGRAAHAGVEPERGVSAIAAAAQAISRLEWGRLDEFTTANIGTVSGGSARNAVPAAAVLEGEVRGLDAERARIVASQIADTFRTTAAERGAAADVQLDHLYAGYSLLESEPVVQLASRAFATLSVDREVRLVRSGGGSDANELNGRGIRACVLGIGAEACHSVAERMPIDELELLAEWILAVIRSAQAV
jgi:tripeptide aminopeptidase